MLINISQPTRLDASNTWTSHSNTSGLQIWINAFVTGVGPLRFKQISIYCCARAQVPQRP